MIAARIEYRVRCLKPFIYADFRSKEKAHDYYTDMLVKYPSAKIEFYPVKL